MLRPLQDAVAGWHHVTAADDPLAAVCGAWAGALGEEVARNARPDALREGTLLVVTRSAAWSQQLSLLTDQILAALRRAAGHDQVRALRFRVGRVSAPAATRAHPRAARSRPLAPGGSEAPTLQAALVRFRENVTSTRRAKRRAGWKECRQCGALLSPAADSFCVPCGNARSSTRARAAARILFEQPWIGFAGTASLIEGLQPDEYEAIRRRLLTSWWDVLTRLRRSGRRSITRRERLIASSYVVLKSGLDPRSIAPAVARNLLEDELYALIFGNESSTT